MRAITTTLTALVLFLLLSSRTQAQQKPATCADWFAVQSWTGTLTYSGSGSGSDQHGNSEIISESARIDFTTAKGSAPCNVNGGFTQGEGIWGWTAQGIQSTYHVNMHDSLEIPGTDKNGNPCTSTESFEVSNGTSTSAAAQVNVHFTSATSGTHVVNAAQHVDGVTETIAGSCGGSLSQVVPSFQWGPSLYPPNGVPLPIAIGPLTGSQTFTAPGGVGEPVQWTVSWNITPNINWDVQLRTSPDYSAWRPQAGQSETDPSAGLLGVNVFVVDKDTGLSTASVSVGGWTVELKNVSHEPGVSMNFPAKNKLVTPSPPDLDFKDLNGILPNVKVSEDGLTLEATPDPATDNQLVFFMNSRDWGAWGTLNITTTVAGQTIKAHFVDDDTTDILLPKRQQNSMIADGWKQDHGIALDTADSDDSETDPNGDSSCIGDGLTLYEEYRGFMEKGKHVEGDPTKKDLFIQNLVGGDAEPGILLFTKMTGLNVHKGLRTTEMEGLKNGAAGDRLINFNHAQGAQEVPQHGVVIATCTETNGGVTFVLPPGVHGRPGLTQLVCIEWRDHGGIGDPQSLGTANTHHGSITPQNALLQYDMAVAHELAHSVGAEHHGEGDTGNTRFTLLGPNDPRNTTGRPAFSVAGQAGVVHVLQEQTGADLAGPMWDKLVKNLSTTCSSVSAIYSPSLFNSNCQAFVNGAVPLFTDLAFYVGRPQKEHSGNDQCVMRYFFANGYPSATNTSTYYLSAAGTEPLGSTLCSSPAGTGINATSHKPQSRYSDATTGRGACQGMVCINDKYPPKPL